MNKIKKILVIAGVACGIYGIINSAKFPVPIWLLPIIYSLGMYLCKNIIIKNTPGVLTLTFLMFLRYVFAPYAYYTDGTINTMALTTAHLAEGLALMLYELVAIFVTLEITGKKYHSKYNGSLTVENRYRYDLQMKNGFIILASAIIILLYIGLSYKSLGQGLSTFVNNSYNDLDDIENQFESGMGYVNIVWQSLCVWLYIYLIMKEKNANEKNPSFTHILRAVLYTIVFVILTFIDSTGVTRWFTFVSAIASLSCLADFFPTHRKTVGLTILIPLTALMIFSSLVKNGGYVSGSTTVAESAEGTFGSTNMDVYCNGLGNVNSVFVLADKDVGINAITILYDAIRSMPVVNHYIDRNKLSTFIYNRSLGREDQIIPLIGQSYLYFGFLLSPLLSILIIIVIRRLDLKFYCNNSYTKYAYAFAVVWIAAAPMCHNVSLIFMWLYIRLIPFFVVLAYTDKNATKTRIII